MGTLRHQRAFTLLELFVTIVVSGALALFVVLPMVTPRGNHNGKRINCVNNLKQVGLSFRLWAGDNGDKYPMQYYTNAQGGPLFMEATNVFLYFQVMSNELYSPKVVICPAEKKRTYATNFSPNFKNPNVSYFVALDADETNPMMILSGDRHITNGLPLKNGVLTARTNRPSGWTTELHEDAGNIAFADGSVQQLSSSSLRAAVAHSGVSTNRLLMP